MVFYGHCVTSNSGEECRMCTTQSNDACPVHPQQPPHKIGRAHTRAEMANAVLVEIRQQSWGATGVFVCTDDRGTPLEIGVIGADEDVGLWIVIHVMPRRFRNE